MSPARAFDLVARACDLIEGWVGVTLTGAAPHRLRAFLGRRAHALGFHDADSYLEHVEAMALDEPEPRRLINLVTNGLTAFWRDEPQLDAVRLALEQLARSRRARSAPLSIWCAGCSTGEEAYTLRMLTLEAGLPAVILGTDVNTDFLDHARAGVYSPWSLRRLSARRQRDHFIERPGRDFEISPPLRQGLYFRQHNLLDPPPGAPQERGWDILLCRNVLIYFRERATRQVMDRFAEALQPDGYLMLGSSEQLSSYYPRGQIAPFRATRHGAGFVYRLADTPPGRTAYNLPLWAEPDPLASLTPARGSSDLSKETVELDAEQAVGELIASGMEHLAARQRETAMACFEAAAGYDPFTPETYYLIGLMLKGRSPRRAVDTMRKVLFLNPMHWLAAFELARMHQERGEEQRARLACRQALEGIEHSDPQGAPLFTLPLIHEYFEPTPRQRDRIRQACQRLLHLSRGR